MFGSGAVLCGLRAARAVSFRAFSHKGLSLICQVYIVKDGKGESKRMGFSGSCANATVREHR